LSWKHKHSKTATKTSTHGNQYIFKEPHVTS